MQIERLIQKLNLLAIRSPGCEVYITLNGVVRDIKSRGDIYELPRDKVVLIDGDQRFMRDFLIGRRLPIPEELESTRDDTADTE